MSRNAWNLIKSSKGFNVSIYRTICTALVISMGLNVIGCFWISHIFFERPAHAYYSTNGATPPALLTALEKPNDSDVPLLPSNESGSEGESNIKQSVE